MVSALENWPLTAPLMVVAGIIVAVLLIGIAWRGTPGEDRLAQNAVQRLAKNSLAPIVGQLASRGVDLVFAAFVLRLLGVTGNGEYAIAVVTWLYVKTISDFGLGLLVTREIARHPGDAGRLLGTSTLLRIVVLAVLLVPVAGYVLGSLEFTKLSTTSSIAIALLTISIIPSSYTEAINSVFNGFERMALPAVLNLLTNVSRAGFGLAALFAGYGVVGLAVVALLSTAISTIAYHVALRHLSVRPEWGWNWAESRRLMIMAWPLLLNALLLNLFFRADVFVIQASQGDRALGIYDAAYKFINLLLLVPAYFTLAAFPLLSRYAADNRGRFIESYRLATKFMLVIAWPVVIGTMALAPLMIGILGGDAFLPDSATALRILVWFAPLSYVNGITQYVLVATNQQRTITWAFASAVAFNIVANVLFVPEYGYMAAAAITVATEAVLFLVLSRPVRQHVGSIGWASLMIRPLGAAGAMAAVEIVAQPLGPIPAVALAIAAYAGALVMFRVIGQREVGIARALLGRPDPITL